nr:MAG TPA: hypothetical protein [Caudoviricetes sp.]
MPDFRYKWGSGAFPGNFLRANLSLVKLVINV